MSLPGFTANASLYRTTNLYRAGLGKTPLTESDVRNLHRDAMQPTAPNIAGQYSKVRRYVRTQIGRHEFPSPAEIPTLMRSFARWLGSAPDTPETAFAAHRHLVDIHPFNDGNGRTARRLMNLILTRGGYPPVVFPREDRSRYLRSLEHHQAGRGNGAFDTLLYQRLKATMASRCYSHPFLGLENVYSTEFRATGCTIPLTQLFGMFCPASELLHS